MVVSGRHVSPKLVLVLSGELPARVGKVLISGAKKSGISTAIMPRKAGDSVMGAGEGGGVVLSTRSPDDC